MTLLAAFVLPAWLGAAVVGACGGFGRGASATQRAMGGILALPLGVGLVSAIAFLWLAALRPLVGPGGEVALELLLGAALSAVWLRRRQEPQTAGQPACRPPLLLAGLGGLALAVGIARLVRAWLAVTSHRPGGDWDAVAIWNLKARFLFWPEGWSRAFSPEIAWSHPDYPLLLPAFIARTWIWLGERTWLAPALTGLAFLLLLAALATVWAYRFRGWVPALVSGVLVCGVAHTSLGFNQYADMPLAFYFLAANALLLESAREPQAKGVLVLTGFAAGAMVWTKNEGWVMLAALVTSEAMTAWHVRLPASELRARALAFAAGLLPLGGTTVLFKLTLAPANDIAARAAWSGLFDIGRLGTIVLALGKALLGYGVFPVPLVAVLLGFVLISGVAVPPALRSAAISLALRLLLVLAAYCATFAITPYPFEWHLATTLERLLSQLLPSAVLLAVLVCGSLDTCTELSTPPPPPSSSLPCDSTQP